MKRKEITSKETYLSKKLAFENVDKRIKVGVLGVGGGGSNAVVHAADSLRNISNNLDFLIINTDIQALKKPGLQNVKKMLIGETSAKGFGSGGVKELGKKAALESKEKIREFIKDKDILFISAGLGGGTGSGASPIIAKIAKEEKVLALVFGTLPWRFEGIERYKNAVESNNELIQVTDSLILFDNELFLDESRTEKNESLSELFKEVNDSFVRSILTLMDLIYDDSLINVDFNDIKNSLRNSGYGLFNAFTIDEISFNEEDIEDNLKNIQRNFAEKFNSKLSSLDQNDVKQAKNIVLNISGSKGVLKMNLIHEIIKQLEKHTNPDVDYIFGVSYNEYLNDKIKISYLITGLNKKLDQTLKQVNVEETKNANIE